MDKVSVMVVAMATWSSRTTGWRTGFADGEDGSLRRVDDRGELADAVVAVPQDAGLIPRDVDLPGIRLSPATPLDRYGGVRTNGYQT